MKYLKYNYVIFGACDDYYKASYNELNKYDNVKLVMNFIDSKNTFLNQLFRIHSSPTINSKFNLPFKTIWNSIAFKNSFTEKKPICFIFFARNQLCNPDFIDYLRNNYPNCKCVAFFQDLVEKTYIPNLELLLKEKLDLVLSFDFEDARNYELTYYPSVYSPLEFSFDNQYDSDVYFVGKAKDRLNIILSVYEKLREAGLKCDFNIAGVTKKERKYNDSINYCKNLPYIENLKHIKGTKCILEVMQGGGTGYTLRYAEAIMYNKKLLTNNNNIKNSSFYNAKLISTFNNIDDLDTYFPLKEVDCIDYQYKDNLLPSKMLEFIDKKFMESK